MTSLDTILSQAERLLELDERIRRDCGSEHPQAKFLAGMLTREGWDAELATLLASAPDMASLLRRLLPVVKAADAVDKCDGACFSDATHPDRQHFERKLDALTAALTAAQEVEHE